MARKLDQVEAKRLYCEENVSLPEIATRLNVPEKTLYRWRADEDWDKEREEIHLTSFSAVKAMLRTAVERMRSMEEEIRRDKKINPSEVYALRQLILSAKSLQKEVDSLGNIMLAMQEFTEFLGDREPETLTKLHPLLIEFGDTVRKKYAKKG